MSVERDDVVDDGECQDCGCEILKVNQLYHDGDVLPCPECGAIHQVCCDSETPVHLHGPADADIG